MSFLNRSGTQLIPVALLALMTACSAPDDQAGPASDVAPTMDTLVSAEWLREHLDDPDLVVLDTSVIVEMDEKSGYKSVNGRASYDAGHIPTAGFADLMGDLSDGDSPFEFTAPAPEQFAAAMSALGVSDNSRVVLYDNYNGVWAARVWWMLRWIGFDRAALLDGGLNAWTAAGGPLSTEPANRPAGELSVALRPKMFADRDEVFASIEDDAVVVIDALSGPVYRGEMTMYERPGHISGAVNVPTTSLVDEAGRFLPLEELAELFKSDRDTRAITYCGGGIAAASDAFVMTRLGYKDVAIYDLSLQEWAADPENPMEVVDEFDWHSEQE